LGAGCDKDTLFKRIRYEDERFPFVSVGAPSPPGTVPLSSCADPDAKPALPTLPRMPPHPLGPPYRIETPRLVLRCWEPADAPARSALMERNLDRLVQRRRLRADQGEPKSPGDRLTELRQMRARFDLDEMWGYAVLTAGDGALAGGATLYRVPPAGVEIGLTAWCGAEYDGQGHESEAAAALARAAYALLDAPRLYGACSTDDPASAALFRELGFTLDGTERHLDGEGVRRDQQLWSLLPGEWPASPAAARAADACAFGARGDPLF